MDKTLRGVYKYLVTSKLIKTTFITKWYILFYHRGQDRTPITSKMEFFFTLATTESL